VVLEGEGGHGLPSFHRSDGRCGGMHCETQCTALGMETVRDAIDGGIQIVGGIQQLGKSLEQIPGMGSTLEMVWTSPA
jgi:hypothetical protein